MNRKIRLGIDARIFSQPMSGVGRYTAALLDHLHQTGLFDMTLFTDTPLRDEHAAHLYDWPVVDLPQGCPRKRWRDHVLPQQLKNHQIDVYHATWDKGVPMRAPCPTVMSIHDLFYIMPENEHLSSIKKYKRKIDLCCETKACRRIFTVSRCSQDDIINYLGVPVDKITVTHLDCDCGSIDASLAAEPEDHPYSDLMKNGQYFVSIVGRLGDKRKNIPFLLRSFSKFLHRDYAKRSHYQLLLVGAYRENEASYQTLCAFIREKGLENNIKLTGYIPDTILYPLLRKSRAMILVSLFEGFGIPVLEAFYLGVPVIAGNSCAMAEVSGQNASLLIDPTKEERLADAMAKIMLEPEFTQTLVENGKDRLKDFSWQNSMDKVIQVYQELATCP